MDLPYFEEGNGSLSSNHSYLKLHPGSAIPYLTIMSLASLCGTLGNILVICAVLKVKELWSVGNLFIVNLAVADLCITAFVEPFSIVGVVKPESWFNTRPGMCTFVAFVCLTSCFCSLLTIGFISVNRYVHICHWKWYNKIFTLRKTVLMCVGLWVFSAVAEMPNFLGWGIHIWDRKYLNCSWDRTASLSYSIFFATVGVFMPLSTIGFIYAMIYRHLKMRNPTIQLVHAVGRMVGRERHDLEDHVWMVFVCFVLFAICWLPYAVAVVFDYNDVYPHQVHLYIGLLAHISSSLNSIVYGVSNKSFRHAYLRLLGLKRFTFKPLPEGKKGVPLRSTKGETSNVNCANEPMLPSNNGNINI